MNDTVISATNVRLDYPRKKKGAGLLREIVTGRFKERSRKDRWFRALNGINLEVKRGEVIGIMGANGSGKSTLLRVIAGIYAPDEGSVEVEGRITLLAGIGTGFNQDLTGRENIKLTGSIFGFDQKSIIEMEEGIIEFSGIRKFIDDPIRTYSAGMRARLGFAIISNLEPDILLLDEVMSVGDHEFRKKSRARIDELVQGDTTVVIVSHSKSILKSMCTKVYGIQNGQIITDGELESAFDFYESENLLSENSQLLLDKFTELSLSESVITCIKPMFRGGTQDKITSIIQYLRDESSKLPAPHYIEESTSGDKEDPKTHLESQLRNGWQTGGGFRLPLTKAPEWSKYFSHSRNVRYKIHSWVMLDSLLVVDSLVEGDEYLELAVAIADDWIHRFVISSIKDDFAWYDMAVGQRATKLAYMLRRLIEINASEDQIFRFILASEIHFSELLDEDRIAIHSNHGLFQMAGLLSLCHNITWMSKSSGSIQFAERILQKMLNGHFAKGGLHLEHSPDYHLYMVNHLQSLKNSGWLSQNRDYFLKLLNSIAETADWMCTPNHHVIPIGDTANNVLMTKRWRGYQGNLKIGHRFFPIGGLLINNSDDDASPSQLIFSAQFHSRQHKHADDLNVLYNLFGQPLLVDPGTYTYQYDLPERMYCESTRGHNTVEIDGLNYSRFRQDAFGSAMTLVAKADKCIIAEGRVKHSRLISAAIPNNIIKSTDAIPVDILQRRIVIERPGHFLAIIDEINSETKHEYIPWYHFHPNLVVRNDTSTRLGVFDEDGKKYCQIQCYDNDSNSIDHIEARGQIKPRLQGWFSRNGRELVDNAAIGFPLVGKSYFGVTVFDFKMEKTGKPYLRTGTGGKYLRFSLAQGEEKMDVKLKMDNEGKRSIEVEIDNSSVDISIVFDDDCI